MRDATISSQSWSTPCSIGDVGKMIKSLSPGNADKIIIMTVALVQELAKDFDRGSALTADYYI